MSYKFPNERFAVETKDRHVDQQLEKISHVLDQAFRIPGTDIRFGLDPIIGFLLPVAGDSINALLSIYIVLKSISYGIPKVVIGRMIFNVALDYVVGSIPFVGDLLDFGFKANKKNVDLLNRFATGEGRAHWTDWLWVFILLLPLVAVVVGCLLFMAWMFKSFSILTAPPGA